MNDQTQDTLQRVCQAFRIPGSIMSYSKLTSGNINTTYSVRCNHEGEEKSYVVQNVNSYVFKDPVAVMHNIDLVTGWVNDPEAERRRRLHFHHVESGENYFRDGEDFWRVSNFIEDSVSFDTGDRPEVLRMAGKAYGRFASQLCNFDASQLAETIPNFHNTRLRLEKFLEDVRLDPVGRCASCWEEIGIIARNRELGSTLCELLEQGELPLRVTHNDTKTNNVLFDKDTLEPLVVIDLDTVMPGLAAYDFGDTVRFAANTAAEDERDISKVSLDLERFRAFAEGYIGETADILTQREIETMVLGCITMTLELASRFLDDYITGDKYFKTYYSTHNLVRTRCQLALLEDMLAKRDEMETIVLQVAGLEH